MTNEIATQTGSTELSTSQDRGLHVSGDFTKYSADQRAQLRALGGLDEASDGDLDMLAAFSDRTGLDPFTKEVYLVGRKTKTGGYRGEPERWETKWTVQTGIDGFRKVTHRAAESKGQPVQIERAVFYDKDGEPRPFWSKSWGVPMAAEVTVRIGESFGVGIATWEEYVQTKRNGEPNSMWEKMGPTMLAKCAEAQAHRRVTPLTAGMYTPEEMGQAESPVQMTATRMAQRQDVAQQALAAPAPKKKQEPQPEPEAKDDQFVEDVKAALAELTSPEDVTNFMQEIRQDSDVPQSILDLGRQRWNELQEEGK